MKKYLLAIALFLGINNATAGEGHTQGLITMIYFIDTSAYLDFKLDNMPTGVNYYRISKANENFKEMLSMILACKGSGKKIEAWYDDNAIEAEETVTRLIWY